METKTQTADLEMTEAQLAARKRQIDALTVLLGHGILKYESYTRLRDVAIYLINAGVVVPE